MTFKINIDDKLLSFVILKDDKNFDWTELDKLDQVKIISAICRAYEFLSKRCKQLVRRLQLSWQSSRL